MAECGLFQLAAENSRKMPGDGETRIHLQGTFHLYGRVLIVENSGVMVSPSGRAALGEG